MKTNIARQLVAQGRRYVQQNPEKVRAMTDKAGEFVDPVSYTHLTLPTIYSV